MKATGTMHARRYYMLFVGFILSLSMQLPACKKQAQESVVTESAAPSGGFRIAPTQAARDVMRPKVIYRCNAVNCGEAFQPSNEEREVVLPCDLDKLNFPAGVLPPYYRVVTERGVQQLIVNVQHQAMCKEPKPFQEVVLSTTPSSDSSGVSSAGTGCQKFRDNQELCMKAAADGCSWVSHPSGRESMGRSAGCIGLMSGASMASGLEKQELYQVDKTPVQWSSLESYRAAP